MNVIQERANARISRTCEFQLNFYTLKLFFRGKNLVKDVEDDFPAQREILDRYNV